MDCGAVVIAPVATTPTRKWWARVTIVSFRLVASRSVKVVLDSEV
jgi:hypothetical protein